MTSSGAEASSVSSHVFGRVVVLSLDSLVAEIVICDYSDVQWHLHDNKLCHK